MSEPENLSLRKFKDLSRQSECLKGFSDLFVNKTLCDVKIKSDGKTFSCHKALLVTASPYFKSMFTSQFIESDSSEIEIKDIKCGIMENVLEYIYSGELLLKKETISALFVAAHMLQLSRLENACSSFMETLVSTENCIETFFFAQLYNQNDLKYKSASIILSGEINLLINNILYGLSADDLCQILQWPMSNISEYELCCVAIKWIEMNKRCSKQDAFNIMSSIRFTLLEENYFRQEVRNKSLFLQNDQLQKLFQQVVYIQHYPSRWHEVDLNLEDRLSIKDNQPQKGRWLVYTNETEHQNHSSYMTVIEMKSTILNNYNSNQNIKFTDMYKACSTLLGSYYKKIIDVTFSGGSEIFAILRDDKSKKECCAFYDKYGISRSTPLISSMSIKRKAFGLCQVDQYIFAIGGLNKDTLDSVEKFIPDRSKWNSVQPMPFKVHSMACISFRGKLYTFGGQVKHKGKRKETVSQIALCYDPSKDEWNQCRSLKTPRSDAAAVVYKDKIWVVGGYVSIQKENSLVDKSSIQKSVEIYNPELDSWEKGPDLPIALYAMGAVKYNATIFIMGGFGLNGSNTHFFFLNSQKKWTQDTNLHLPHPLNAQSSYGIYPFVMDYQNVPRETSPASTHSGFVSSPSYSFESNFGESDNHSYDSNISDYVHHYQLV